MKLCAVADQDLNMRFQSFWLVTLVTREQAQLSVNTKDPELNEWPVSPYTFVGNYYPIGTLQLCLHFTVHREWWVFVARRALRHSCAASCLCSMLIWQSHLVLLSKEDCCWSSGKRLCLLKQEEKWAENWLKTWLWAKSLTQWEYITIWKERIWQRSVSWEKAVPTLIDLIF